MATASRDTVLALTDSAVPELPPGLRALWEKLHQEPFQFRFFQAVRLLQKMNPERGPVGYFIAPHAEAIRFVSRTSLGFPPSELHALTEVEDGQVALTVEFMGLCAAVSVLPSVYTEYLLDRARDNDMATEEFLNIFNHRLISFFYRGWAKYRLFIDYERSGSDRLAAPLFDLLGLGSPELRERTGIESAAFLHYIGLLGRGIRSVASLQQVLEDFFEVPVRVEQFAGTWRKLPPDCYTRFSGYDRPSEQLGVGVIAGEEVWDQHGRIRLFLGPMPLSSYLQFLPDGPAHAALASWLRFFSNGNYETEVRLILARSDVPDCALGGGGDARPQLGFVSWLKTKKLDRDPADATYVVS